MTGDGSVTVTAVEPTVPWALEVLREQFDARQALVRRTCDRESCAAVEGLIDDLLRAVDRHLRLEHEVFHPALEVAGIDAQAGRTSHAVLRAALDRTVQANDDRPQSIVALGQAIASHRQVEERALFPEAARLPEAEMVALGLELDEVRQRMCGAYGV